MVALLLSISAVKAEYDTPWEYFIYGIKFCIGALFEDIFTRTKEQPLDAYKTVAEIIMTAGYRFETHKIVTQDKYINTAWRIVGRLNSTANEPKPETKPCVILQHGLIDNSATWLIPNRSIALPFTLADEGYDVWMTNSRGNINSYEHMNPETHNVKDITKEIFNLLFIIIHSMFSSFLKKMSIENITKIEIINNLKHKWRFRGIVNNMELEYL